MPGERGRQLDADAVGQRRDAHHDRSRQGLRAARVLVAGDCRFDLSRARGIDVHRREHRAQRRIGGLVPLAPHILVSG